MTIKPRPSTARAAHAGALLLAVLLAMLVVWPNTARAVESFCPSGSGLGQCSAPRGVAIDWATGNVYVVDQGNNRINVFDEAGEFLFSFGSPGFLPGQFNSPSGIAIDNEPTSPGYRSVYVGTDNYRVQKFNPEGVFQLAFGSQGSGPGQFNNNEGSPIAVAGSSGTVYVAERTPANVGRVQRFSPAGVQLGELQLGEPATIENALDGMAVTSTGEIFIGYSGSTNLAQLGLWKYLWAEPTATFVGRFDFGADTPSIRTGLALGPDGDVYASQLIDQLGNGRSVITRFAPDGSIQHRFGYGEIGAKGNTRAIAINSDGTQVYFSSEQGEVTRIAVPPPGPVVVLDSAEATDLGNTSATLRAGLNPEGAASTYHAEYVEESAYQADLDQGGDGYGSAVRAPVSASDDPQIGGPGDFGLHQVSVAVGCPDPASEAGEPGNNCLLPSIEYRFRMYAENADGAGAGPVEGSFETKPPLQIVATWSSEVGMASARLNAEVNPFGIPASGFFEYVGEAAYLADLAAGGDGFASATQGGEVDFGAGSSGTEEGVFVADLNPGSYRYRVVVDNALIEPLAGPARKFTTKAPPLSSAPCPNDSFRTGPGSKLPDCRAYEMVSPVDKGSGDIVTVGNISGNPGRHNQSSLAGGRLTYSSYRAFGKVQSSPFTSQYLASRDPGTGWVSQGISPPRGVNILKQGDSLDVEFKAFSADLCVGWLRHDSDPPLAAGGVEGFANLYQRDNCDSGEGSFGALTTTRPYLVAPKDYAPELKEVSDDGSTAAFTAPDRLTALPTGSQLDCTAGNTPGTITYQWLRNGEIIPSASAPIYTSAAADANKAIQCQVTSITASSGSIQVANPPIWIGATPAAGEPVAPSSLPVPTTSAPLAVGGGGGQALSCATEEEEWEGVGSFAFRWYRSGVAIMGAESQSYSPTAGDLAVPASFQCVVTGSGSQGAVSVASENLLTEPAPESPVVPDVTATMPSDSKCYSSRNGQLSLVGILPNGRATRESCWIGTAGGIDGAAFDDGRSDSVHNAVSADGSRIFWSVPRGRGQIYVRINGAQTLPVSAVASAEPARFWGASSTGDRAIVTVKGPGGGSGVYPPEEGLHVVDVDEGQDEQIAGRVIGVLGMSEDARRIYFVSREALGGDAEAGAPNLYLHESDGEGGGSPQFIAALGGADVPSINQRPSPFADEPRYHTSRVSASGSHAVFMSTGSLTGYDNIDLGSGKPAAAVYRYEVGDGSEAGRLLCVSCNPTGSRPTGRELLWGAKVGSGIWAAAKIATTDSQLYSPRVMSADGSRIYFESYESLVTRDSNGTRADVYQWQLADGVERCRQLGAEQYVEEAGGCISLISSGESGKDSEFIDSSANGNDVFIATDSGLVTQDPGQIDIYDARAGGGFPAPDLPKPPCSGEACQSPPPPPEAPTPSSSNYQGVGNIPSGTPQGRQGCPKGKVKRGKKCVGKRAKAKKKPKKQKHHKSARRAR